MEQRHLRYFVAVAEELHFGRAATRLHISQPPLSQQIRALERELGVELFSRAGRRVELTHAGRVFLEHAREVLATAEEAARAARRAARGEVGRLVVGFIHAATFELLPRILSAFRRRMPQVELTLLELAGRRQTEMLADGRIDVGFLRPPLGDATLQSEVLVREPLVVGLPWRHALSRKSTVALADLAQAPFVIFTPHLSPLYGQVLSACMRAGFAPNVVQEARHIVTLVSLVRAGVGVALLPGSVRALKMDRIHYRALDYAGPHAEMAVAWRRGDASPIARAFLEVARASATQAARGARGQ